MQKELSRHDELDSGRAGLTLAITTALANHINLQKSCLGRVSDSIMGMYKKAINQLVNELISVSDQEGFYACNIYAAIPEERQKHFIKLIVATTREVLMPSHRSGFCSFFRSKQNPSIDDLLSNLKKLLSLLFQNCNPEFYMNNIHGTEIHPYIKLMIEIMTEDELIKIYGDNKGKGFFTTDYYWIFHLLQSNKITKFL